MGRHYFKRNAFHNVCVAFVDKKRGGHCRWRGLRQQANEEGRERNIFHQVVHGDGVLIAPTTA